MASKSYEIQFLLRAQLDDSLRQFSLLGGHVKELEQKIQQFNQTLGEIDGFRRQQEAVANYQQKLRDLESTTAQVNQKATEASRAQQEAAASYSQHAAEVERLKRAVDEEKLAQIEEVNQMKAAGKTHDEITAAKGRHAAENGAER